MKWLNSIRADTMSKIEVTFFRVKSNQFYIDKQLNLPYQRRGSIIITCISYKNNKMHKNT